MVVVTERIRPLARQPLGVHIPESAPIKTLTFEERFHFPATSENVLRALSGFRRAIDHSAIVRGFQRMQSPLELEGVPARKKEVGIYSEEIELRASSAAHALLLGDTQADFIAQNLLLQNRAPLDTALREMAFVLEQEIGSPLVWIVEKRKPDQTIADLHTEADDGDIRLTIDQYQGLEWVYAAEI